MEIDSNKVSEEAVQNKKHTHRKWSVSWPNNRSERWRFYGNQSNKCWTLQHLHPLVSIIHDFKFQSASPIANTT